MQTINQSTQLADDLLHLRTLLADFFTNISTADPHHSTERNGNGWTLHQTLAHVAAISEYFYQALDATLTGVPFHYPGLNARTDLRPVNEREITERLAVPPQTLVQTLLDYLERTANCARTLTHEQLALTVNIPAYNRPMTLSEVIGGQLGHVSIIHAAQLANGMNVHPFWLLYTPDFMQRQLTHFFNMMSHAYWPEHGGNLCASINFYAGAQQASWHITIDPSGGSMGQGTVNNADLHIWTPNMVALCNLLTMQYSLPTALLTRQMFAWGNVLLALKIGYLFEN